MVITHHPKTTGLCFTFVTFVCFVGKSAHHFAWFAGQPINHVAVSVYRCSRITVILIVLG